MFKHFLRRSRLALLAVVAIVSTGAQANLIVSDSTYSGRIFGSYSGNSEFTPITFDGLWESFVRTTVDGNEITVHINESQTDLGGGRHLIEFFLVADSDMFPSSGEGGYLNIGGLDPLDLLGPVMVESAFLAFFVGDTLLADGDFYASFSSYFSEPWDGGFLNDDNVAAGWVPVGATGVTGMHLRITTRAIPIPAPLLLLGLGCTMLLLATRRRGESLR